MDARELPQGGHLPRDSVESLDLLGGYTDLPETSHASPDQNHHHHHHHHHHQQSQSNQEDPQYDNHYSHYDDYSHYTQFIEDHEPRHAVDTPSTGIDDAAVQTTTSAVSRALPFRTLDYSSAPAASTRPVPPGTPALYNTNAIKRKPLSSSAAPLTILSIDSAQSLASVDLPKPEARFSRPFQADSPTLYEHPVATIRPYQPDTASPLADYYISVEDEQTPTLQPDQEIPDNGSNKGSDERSQGRPDSCDEDTDRPLWPSRKASINNPVVIKSESPVLLPEYGDLNADISPTTKTLDTHPVRPPVIVEEEGDTHSESAYSTHSNDTSIILISTPPTTAVDSTKPPDTSKPLPKSPGSSKFGAFFNWALSPSPSTTEFSSLPSPISTRHLGSIDDTNAPAHSILQRKGSKPNVAPANPLGYCETNLLTPPPLLQTSSIPGQIQEMEDELKAISAELAASIRREMDLEDLVDKLQAEASNPQAPNKRTSDYFSDSGASSTKFSDFDANKEEVERIQRRAEQEKASIRLELTNKVQHERDKRKDLDRQIRELSERASQVDMDQLNNVDVNGRVRELEQTCEDLRRRLADERKVKENFEDLLSALRGELENASNERDNLRDEVVPQLRAQLEGLETEAAEYANLTYESTKMQQELQSLKSENRNLRDSKQISEGPPSRSSVALSRSNSVTGGSFRLQRPPTSLSRSNTVKGSVESREALAERLKDVEAQRDALHTALRNLLERQEYQNRENEKKIKVLEMERERLLSDSPEKKGFERDVSNLRHEIKILRRRAEEAMEHKWQAETGLAGLKMDLDRAEGEIASLRALLEENDIAIPSPSSPRASGTTDSVPATASIGTFGSLEPAFKALQASHQQSLARIRELEAEGIVGQSEKTQLALQRFEQSLSAAIWERDAALQESSDYKAQVDQLLASEAQHLEGELALAGELAESTRRVEELAAQVGQQLAANADLRQRLSDTVAQGDAERKANGERITSLQSRLRHLEEQVVLAQTAAEERVARHEEQIRELKEAHSHQLRRAPPSPLGSTASRSPGNQLLSPMASSPFFPRSPRSPRHVRRKSIGDDAQVDKLRARVAELEQALAEADAEMEDVIARMSTAQIEVLTLQEEREAAVRETRKVLQILEEERVKAFEVRFKSLTTNV
ncbi:hypothetical protein ACRALDRAFT_1075655 [Sodiomyces alcalophilus JCM 7366]|uniref:uncharacterized protein n=1 Tax=Sodiomyces alcalophilus JCM 7366 TaxID=591952 RepID=UPI0039B43628